MPLHRHLNRCEVCGRFLANADPYGDQHMGREHPVQYDERMARFFRRQARKVAGS